jgi:hypothetical protein
METDPASQSATQTPATAWENLARLFSGNVCKNVLFIYPSSLRPTE